MKRIVTAAMVLAMAGAAHATCYDLRDASGNLISSTPTPPFSLAWPEEGVDAKAAKARGGRVIAVNPAYTSQTCPACGHVDAANRQTQAGFVCVACGHSQNADLVAAQNILHRALVDATH